MLISTFLIFREGRAPQSVDDESEAQQIVEGEARALAGRGVDAPAIFLVAAQRYAPPIEERGEAVAGAIEAAAIAELGEEAVTGNLSDDEVRARRGLPPRPVDVAPLVVEIGKAKP